MVLIDLIIKLIEFYLGSGSDLLVSHTTWYSPKNVKL